MLKKLAAVFAATALSALLLAQEPGGPMGTPPDPQSMTKMRVGYLTKILSLTDAQQAKATTIFTDAFTQGETVRQSLQNNRQSLSAAVRKNDNAAIETLATTAGTLTGQLVGIESKAEAAFYAGLTPDQQTKYDAMPRRGPGGRGPMGSDGMRPPRPPQ
jgi:Spy/CpxP family protein refolding chaperone